MYLAIINARPCYSAVSQADVEKGCFLFSAL